MHLVRDILIFTVKKTAVPLEHGHAAAEPTQSRLEVIPGTLIGLPTIQQF
ncbi:MAG TPA: hypothetical protein VGY56_16960 [Verrucomicrobiae bacterium]|nr:hypothetical protein [Verrucomicrobiae bacterium]